MSGTTVRICDCTLRDGSHAIHHRFRPEQVAAIASRLDAAGVYAIEVGHGDGLAGSSIHFGRSAYADTELLSAAVGAASRAGVAVSVQPGVATQDDMRAAHDLGVAIFKVATHCTEADIGIQHLGLARKLGAHAAGGLMMTHMTEPAALAEQARMMADAGAEVVYVADSAGALTMDGMRARVAAVREALDPETHVAVHTHNNMGLGVGNAVVGVEQGARVVDACLAGFGGGAGNCHLEAIVAVLSRMGVETGVDLWQAQDAAEELVRPLMVDGPRIDRSSLSLGYAGVYSSFLLHTARAAERFAVDDRDILVELGERKVVAGQEDMIIEIAAGLAGGGEAA